MRVKRWFVKGLIALGGIALLLIGTLGLWVRIFGYEFYSVPAGSMKPTLLIGDHVFARNLAEDEELSRGDILFFQKPPEGQITWVKRLIGLPGDRIAMQDGRIILNGTPLTQTPSGVYEEVMAPQGPQGAVPRCMKPTVLDEICEKQMALEEMPEGRSYHVLDIAQTRYDTTAEVEVPAGHYFFMGDNRDNSIDSRVVESPFGPGFVPRENIHGAATRILLSRGGGPLDFSQWRNERTWMEVE